MDKYSPRTMMHKDTAAKRSLSKLNSCITCKLCKGYFVDATTIIECLHTFCRSCIVKYLESNKYCPICDVQVHKTKPLLNIRQDKTIQDLVYKMVPRLYHNEAKRRKLFYEANTSTKPSICEENMAALYEFILTPEESINLTLNYYACTATPRYLRCSTAVSIAHLKKLISAKYDLTDRHRVDMFYKQEVLSPTWSLMDVAYIHSWKKTGTLDLTYKIYERWAKKPKLEGVDLEKGNTSNSNNWKEVQLRISENGEMSITGIQDALELLDATAKFKSEIVINESKILEDSTEKQSNPVAVEAKEQNTCTKDPLTPSSTIDTSTTNSLTITTTATPKSATIMESQSTAPLSSLFTITVNSAARTSVASKPSSVLPRSIELSETLNLNSELSVIPLNVNANGVSRSSCGTTTVFSTINKSMCSTKSEESCNVGPPPKTPTDASKELPLNSILKQNNSLKRKMEESEKFASELPTKLPKPTILNHSIGLMSLSNNHPLKKHSSKMSRNGECRHIDIGDKVHNLTASLVAAAQRNTTENSLSKPIIINKSPNYLNQLSKGVSLSKIQKSNNSGNVPCYMPKERNGDKEEGHEKAEKLCISKPPSHQYQNSHHPPIITPSQLPHHQNLHIRGEPTPQTTISVASPDAKSVESSPKATSQNVSDTSTSVKSKPSTPIGYKTLRDPPKSWNSQINSQIAKVNQSAKLANLAGVAAQGRLGGDLKNVRPPKFFKGRNMPRYLGNPASGVKPMYQVQISHDKDKGQEFPKSKSEKSEIKKHSIVKIDPKTLRPISEKAPETTSLSNMQSGPNTELRLNSTGSGDLKINISSVSIFNPLKLQQSSPKSERRSPKSPHSPKVRATANGGSTASTTITTSSSTPPLLNALSPKQQRDKISLTTPPNPYIPNLASPTLNPNQFLYPAGGFPSYDPRFMAACHNLWYTQRIAAAAAAGLVPPPLPHGFGLNIGLNPTGSIGQQSSNPGISPKHSGSAKMNNHTSSKATNNGQQNHQLQKAAKKTKDASTGVKNEKSLETALEKLSQSKVKEATVAKADAKRESNKSNAEDEKLQLNAGKTEKPSEKEVCENLTGDAQEDGVKAVKDSSDESKSQETKSKEQCPVGINNNPETVKTLPTLDKEKKCEPSAEETPSEPAQEPLKPEEKDNATGETAIEATNETIVKCDDKTEPLESGTEIENSVLHTSKDEKETEPVLSINSDLQGDKVEERLEEASSDSVSACACGAAESISAVETPEDPNKKSVEEVSPGEVVVQTEDQATNGLTADPTEKAAEIQAETLGA